MESKIPVNNPMPFPKRERILISVNEAAQMLNLSKSYIYRETRNRTIPHVRIGSRILFRVTDLNAWIEQQNQPALQEQDCA
jgi:excisionase family DNA binding protein